MFEKSLSQSMPHILQKAFFKHTLKPSHQKDYHSLRLGEMTAQH